MYPKREYAKNWSYVDNMIDQANKLGFSPALTQLMAAKWAGEGGRRPRTGSLGLSGAEVPLRYENLTDELVAYKNTVSKILSSKGFNLDDFNNKSTEELFNALQYRPAGKTAGKDYYMFNDVRGDAEYKNLITKTPEYRYFNQDYIRSRISRPEVNKADTMLIKPNMASNNQYIKNPLYLYL